MGSSKSLSCLANPTPLCDYFLQCAWLTPLNEFGWESALVKHLDRDFACYIWTEIWLHIGLDSSYTTLGVLIYTLYITYQWIKWHMQGYGTGGGLVC